MTHPHDHAVDPDWQLPSRGRVGMFSLIFAESAIFVIFVVAYVYNIGRSTFGPQPRQVLVGAMLEVPALAEALDLLLPQLDFLSIGTNDLTQFLFAADRAHPKLAERYDWLSPAILRFIRRVVEQCDAAGVKVGICGEMGGRTLEAMALNWLITFWAYGCASFNAAAPPEDV